MNNEEKEEVKLKPCEWCKKLTSYGYRCYECQKELENEWKQQARNGDL